MQKFKIFLRGKGRCWNLTERILWKLWNTCGTHGEQVEHCLSLQIPGWNWSAVFASRATQVKEKIKVRSGWTKTRFNLQLILVDKNFPLDWDFGFIAKVAKTFFLNATKHSGTRNAGIIQAYDKVPEFVWLQKELVRVVVYLHLRNKSYGRFSLYLSFTGFIHVPQTSDSWSQVFFLIGSQRLPETRRDPRKGKTKKSKNFSSFQEFRGLEVLLS